MEIEKVKKRDRERTKSKILRAVGQVIEQHGTEKVGVNLIARTALLDYVRISGFGLCCGMGSCGTCMVQIDGRFTLACQVPVDDWLANSEIKIEPSTF